MSSRRPALVLDANRQLPCAPHSSCGLSNFASTLSLAYTIHTFLFIHTYTYNIHTCIHTHTCISFSSLRSLAFTHTVNYCIPYRQLRLISFRSAAPSLSFRFSTRMNYLIFLIRLYLATSSRSSLVCYRFRSVRAHLSTVLLVVSCFGARREP